MTYVNLTPHAVTIIPEEGEPVVFEPSGQVARLAIKVFTFGGFSYEGADVVKVGYGSLEDSPPHLDGTLYIVSLVTALAVRRSDFVSPFDEVRDEGGQIIGCRKFSTVS